MDTYSHLVELIRELSRLPGQGTRLGDLSSHHRLPKQGVYFFYEDGELTSGADGHPRVVRVGTHAVSNGSRSTLTQRLRAHRGTRAGGGNHRGSIFRLHVGQALQRRLKSLVPTWAKGSTVARDIRDAEREHEERVSKIICAMPVLWLAVEDAAGPTSERAVIERGAIATLSNSLAPIGKPSDSWLGNHSPREEIRRSGLWNLNYTRESPDAEFIDAFAAAVERTARR